MQDLPWLDYRVRWRAGGSRPGKHAAAQGGQGGDFRAVRPFWQLPDAQHIDIRRSITDPFGDVLVRQMEQRSAITLIVAADISRSMAPSPDRSSLATLATLAEAACRSALRGGDAFGCVVFDETIRHDLSLPATQRRSAGRELADRLLAVTPTGRSATGLASLADHLPARRCLVLLVSDFLLPPDVLDRGLQTLARHDVAPVVLTQTDPDALPRTGLLRLRDAETGATRLLLMRPALHRRMRAEANNRRARLNQLFLRHGRQAFHTHCPIDLAALSRHLTDR